MLRATARGAPHTPSGRPCAGRFSLTAPRLPTWQPRWGTTVNDLDMSKGTDPQADATRADFNRAARVDTDQGVGGDSAERPTPSPAIEPEVAVTDTVAGYRSFAGEVTQDPQADGARQDFNLAAEHAEPEASDGQRIEQPGDPELRPTLPPDLQALQDRLDAKLAPDLGDDVTWKKDRGPNLGL
jgi:hypothetical protein